MSAHSHRSVRARRLSAKTVSRKIPEPADSLVHHGRNVGRTVHAFCNVADALQFGMSISLPDDLGGEPIMALSSMSARQLKEYRLFRSFLAAIPELRERLMECDGDNDVDDVAELIQQGMCHARAADTRGMKGPVLDWISSGGVLTPALDRHTKSDRGFNHNNTGALLCPVGLDWDDPRVRRKLRNGEVAIDGDQWPLFLYEDLCYDPDDPWKGLLRGQHLITGFKHVFLTPTSVTKAASDSRFGNARIHGMKRVTCASIAYIAMQIRFALSSSAAFSRQSDSVQFYHSVLELLEDPDEQEEVADLLHWWNQTIFPGYDVDITPAAINTLAQFRRKRALRKQTTRSSQYAVRSAGQVASQSASQAGTHSPRSHSSSPVVLSDNDEDDAPPRRRLRRRA